MAANKACYVGKIEIASSAPASADKALQVRQASGTWQPLAKSGGRLTSLFKLIVRLAAPCGPGQHLSVLTSHRSTNCKIVFLV
jgi:hypothetical protein